MTTAMATLRAWIPLINLNYGSSAPFSFVDKLANQFRPVSITDCFAQFSIPDHVFYAQTFAANHLIVVYQLRGQFMGKVAAAISNFCLYASNFLSGFLEIRGTFLFPGKGALCFSQFLSVAVGVPGVARFEPIRGNNKVF